MTDGLAFLLEPQFGVKEEWQKLADMVLPDVRIVAATLIEGLT